MGVESVGFLNVVNLESVGLDELLRKLENLDFVGFLNVVNPDSDAVDLDLVVADAVVSLPKHPSNFKVVKCVL